MISVRLIFITQLMILLYFPAQASCPGPGCPSDSILPDPDDAGSAGGGYGPGGSDSGGGWNGDGHDDEPPQPSVADIQRALTKKGFDAGPADGLAGPLTRAAIAAFQTSLGDAATGELTADQLTALLAGS